MKTKTKAIDQITGIANNTARIKCTVTLSVEASTKSDDKDDGERNNNQSSNH